MKQGIRLFFIATALCATCISCGKKKIPDPILPPIETHFTKDTLGYEMENKSKVYAIISIDSPVDLDELSNKNFSMWVSTVLERECSTDKDAVNSLAKAFVTTASANLRNTYTTLDKESKRTIKELYTKVDINKIYEDQKYVTYLFEEEIFDGGSHPMRKSIGYTFNRMDFSLADLIQPEETETYSRQITEELGKTMVSDPSKLMNLLLIDEKHKEQNLVPLPANGAYLVGDSLIFKYQEYEIASYNFGFPTVILSR